MAGLLIWVLEVYSLAVLAVVILSWVAPQSRHPIVELLHRITEPVLAPLRRVLPPMGGIDLSAVVLLLLIRFSIRLVAGFF